MGEGFRISLQRSPTVLWASVVSRITSRWPKDHRENGWRTVTWYTIRGLRMWFGSSYEYSLECKCKLQARIFRRLIHNAKMRGKQTFWRKRPRLSFLFFFLIGPCRFFFCLPIFFLPNTEETDRERARCVRDDVRPWHDALIQHDTTLFLWLWSDRYRESERHRDWTCWHPSAHTKHERKVIF